MKKNLSLLTAFVLLLVSLVGCGGGEVPAGTTEEEVALAPAALVKTATVVYEAVNARYDNVVLYKSGGVWGVLNNDGSVRVPAQYRGITPFNEEYAAFQYTADKANGVTDKETGIMTLDGEVIVSGFYHIDYLGADYVVLASLVECERTHPKCYAEVRETGEAYYLNYSLFSLREREEVPCPALDTINASDANQLYLQECLATETNVLLAAYFEENQEHVSYAYYWESGKTLTGEEFWYGDCYEDGCAKIDGQLYNAKGEPIERCSHGEALIIEERDGYCGVVDANGKEIIPFRYSDIEEYAAGIYAVRLNKSWGFIDNAGQVLMDPIINEDYGDHCFKTEDSNKPCLYNPYTGEKTVYEYLKELDPEKGTYSAYNGTGRAIVTFEKALTEFVYDESGNSIEVSEDGTVYEAQRGSTYDVYVWE